MPASHEKEKSLKAPKEQIARRQSRDNRKFTSMQAEVENLQNMRQSRDNRKANTRMPDEVWEQMMRRQSRDNRKASLLSAAPESSLSRRQSRDNRKW